VKIATVIGARPQFVKAAAVSRALHQFPDTTEIIIHTDQHYDPRMSDIFFRELELKAPEHHLGVGSASHGAQTGRMLERIERCLAAEKPDYVLVYGDTNSTLAGALAAAKLHVPVAHVEAGLRSFNRRMPEEINRVLTDHVADLLFAPTVQAVENLRAEGIPEDRICMVGDVMYDAVLYFGARAREHSRLLADLQLRSGEYVLATLHRAENTDDPVRFRALWLALQQLSEYLPVVLPLHPRSRQVLDKQVLADKSPSLRVIDPVGYLDMLMLEKNARLIATDSGGVQKEAFYCRVPCVTLRDETEWVELVELGWNRLAPPVSAAAVLNALLDALNAKPAGEARPYGDGDSARRIAEILIRRLEGAGAQPGAELTLNMTRDGWPAAPRMLRSEIN
jgi:UDP-GlcNAc3NAcA epimerase